MPIFEMNGHAAIETVSKIVPWAHIKAEIAMLAMVASDTENLAFHVVSGHYLIFRKIQDDPLTGEHF